MGGKFRLALLFSGLLSVSLFQNNNLYAKDTLEDGIIGLTKEEVREKLGKPPFLYCEEEPYRRYVIVKPENESLLRATFLYDVIIHDLYTIKRDGSSLEYRIYYGEDVAGGKIVHRVKEYSVNLSDNPVPLGKVAEIVPEFKPAYKSAKVYQERLLSLNIIRLIFVTPETNELSKHLGSLFVDLDKDIQDWALSYDVLLCAGEPENVSANSMVKEVVVAVDGEYRIGKTSNVFGSKLIKNPLQ
ncbi:MAG: hypothetical protein HZC52_06580 [Planctomycetes bacterium]|nr:hypothetical protein [Planctomycetota bacterium]